MIPDVHDPDIYRRSEPLTRICSRFSLKLSARNECEPNEMARIWGVTEDTARAPALRATSCGN